MTPKETVAAFWSAFYDRDFDRIASFFGDESVYMDVPGGPTMAAKGPDDVVKRLASIRGLAGFDNDHVRTVAEGDVVMTEHAEIWTWQTGETVRLPVLSVHIVQDGVIMLWRDYWDMQTLLSAAPQSWREEAATLDRSWLFDASAIR